MSPNGTGADWSPLRSGTEGVVWTLAASANGVYAGGDFRYAGNNIFVNFIAKWNGSNWSALGSGIDGGLDTAVYALVVSASDLYVGGYFATAGREDFF